jgi:hypothetical protein
MSATCAGDELAQAVQQRRALGGRARRPLREGGASRRHCRVHLRRAAGGHLGERVLRGRVERVQVARAVHRLAVDQVGDAHRAPVRG